MKRIILSLAVLFAFGWASAQTEWAKKAAKSVFTLKTFNAEGTLLASSNGFYIGENGEAVSNFAPFKGAARAVVIDAQGKEYPVKFMLGANDIYDVAKFRVDTKKSLPLAIASGSSSEGSSLWLLPYSAKKAPIPAEAKVTAVQKVDGDNDYYTVSVIPPDNTVSCPFLNTDGEVVGILQAPSAQSDSTQYALGASFARDLKITGLSINDPVLKSTSIPQDLPDELDQAILTLYVGASLLDSAAFNDKLNLFIEKFPSAPDAYVYKAQMATDAGKYAVADEMMGQALKVADKKEDVHYNYAKMIYHKLIYKPDSPYDKWTFDRAVSETDEAIKGADVDIYHTLKAQILFADKRYTEAAHIYADRIAKGSRTADMFFGEARCYEMTGDTAQCIALLDSAVATFSRPYLREAAPYLLARAQRLETAGKYRQAVNDYNDYEKLMSTMVNDNFYYIRSQAELKGHLFQQALNDLEKAISMSPRNTLYYAEKASLETRVGHYDEALATARQCIDIDPKLSDGYLFLGLAQCLKGDKTEGVKNLQKALDMGDPQAKGLIEKYGK